MGARTIANGGGNWSSTSTWVEGIVPAFNDVILATATSGQLTVDTTTAECQELYLVGYTNTLTIPSGQKLLVYTSVVYSSTMTTAGTGELQWGTGTYNCWYTSNGVTTVPNLKIVGTGIHSVQDNLTVSGLTTLSNSLSISGSGSLYLNGGLTLSGNWTGTNQIYLGGGTLSATGAYGFLSTTGTLRFAGNVTISGTIYFSTQILYDSGTITTTGSTIIINGETKFANGSNNISWNNVTFSSNSIIYHGYDMTINGLLTFSNTSSHRGYVGDTGKNERYIYAYGGITSTSLPSSADSTDSTPRTIYLVIKGGTWNGNLNWKRIVFDGNSTLGTSVGIKDTLLSYTSGTITTTNSNLTILSGATTATISATNTFNTITPLANLSLTDNVTCNNYTLYSGFTTSISDTKTLTINTTFTGYGTPDTTSEMKATSGTAYIDYQGTDLNYTLSYVKFTNISAVKSIFVYKGTLDTTTNIYSIDFTKLSAPRVSVIEI